MAAMQIGIATYYRYQKMYQELEEAKQSITDTQSMGQFKIMQWVHANFKIDDVKVKFTGRNAAVLYDKQGGQMRIQYDSKKKEAVLVVKNVKGFKNKQYAGMRKKENRDLRGHAIKQENIIRRTRNTGEIK